MYKACMIDFVFIIVQDVLYGTPWVTSLRNSRPSHSSKPFV